MITYVYYSELGKCTVLLVCSEVLLSLLSRRGAICFINLGVVVFVSASASLTLSTMGTPSMGHHFILARIGVAHKARWRSPF